jgi:ABC-2 type transport system permease protein
MQQPYSQAKATIAIAKASFKALLRSPSAIVFSAVFPFVFILIFGFIGGGGRISLSIAVDKNSDTSNTVYQVLKSVPGIKIISKDEEEIKEDLEKGRIAGIVSIQKNTAAASPAYLINIKSSDAVNPQNLQVLQSIIGGVVNGIDRSVNANTPTIARINPIEKVPGRVFRTIDFILPGQLGFSLLSAGVFGIAFMFFNLRQTLVLKRFYATPIKRLNIVLGEVLARTLFQLLITAVILIIGALFFKYTLVHGVVTFIEIMILCFFGLILFMGFGFIVSGRAKTDSSIPPFANLITLPQFLLGGTFFSVEVFPSWLQPISKALPLTHLNTAMRNIAFEGAHLWNVGKELGIMAIWTIVVYFIAVKVFRWE